MNNKKEEKKHYVSRNITLPVYQVEFVRRASINLSWLVQGLLDDLMSIEEHGVVNAPTNVVLSWLRVCPNCPCGNE